jgi:hypothetical protein
MLWRTNVTALPTIFIGLTTQSQDRIASGPSNDTVFVSENRFKITGRSSGIRESWQLTGISGYGGDVWA